MAEYQQLYDLATREISTSVLRRVDNAVIPDDPANADRQVYLQWEAEGNVPDPPDPLPAPQPPPPDPNVRLDTGVSEAVDAWNANTPPARGGQGGMTGEERIIRLEESMKAMAGGQMQDTTKAAPRFG